MRTILHSDCNNFYASVECAYDPSLRGQPLAVCGSREARHGIVLAKNEQAKKFGIKTGDVIWEAKQKCPTLAIVQPHFDRYSAFSKAMRRMYNEYTDRVEPFGMDECWLDLTGCPTGGLETAALLRQRAKDELGITVSVGVSFNKVFAKLGSDLHKPDATTLITPDNYQEKIWPLPVSDLLFVGRSSLRVLNKRGIYTIGDAAKTDEKTLRLLLGKSGETLHRFACGLDDTPVSPFEYREALQSIGNSTTLPRDISTLEEAKIVLYALADMVSFRLRTEEVKAGCVVLFVRDSALASYERQTRLNTPTNLPDVLAKAAYTLLNASYRWQKPIRALGIRTTQFVCYRDAQLMLMNEQSEKSERLARTIDNLREKYGGQAIVRGLSLLAPELTGFSEHTTALPPSSS